MRTCYYFLPAFFLGILLLAGHFNQHVHNSTDKWNGTVNFVSQDKGPFIVSSEWRMDGNFKNSTGPVIHSEKYQSKYLSDEVTRNCSNTGEGRVEISFDEAKATYTIMVHGVPDCIGSEVTHGEKKPFNIPGGDTAIIIPNQPIGKDRNTLTGTFMYSDGPQAKGIIQSNSFKWNLVKAFD